MIKPARTTAYLRDLLMDEIEELRSGNGDAAKAMSVATLAKQVIGTVKLELEYAMTLQELKERTGQEHPLIEGESSTLVLSAKPPVQEH